MTKRAYYELLRDTSKAGGFPSRSVFCGCAYRSEDGRKCAIGLLIPDGKYSPSLEGKAVGGLPAGTFDLPVGMTLNDLTVCQDSHDIISTNEWHHDNFMHRLHRIECFAEYAAEGIA